METPILKIKGPYERDSSDKSNSVFELLFNEYSDTIIISVTTVIIILVISLILIKYYSIKKSKLPFAHIFNILNKNTMQFFVQKRIKLNKNYFDNLELVLIKYNKFINEVYLEKKENVAFVSVLIILCIVILTAFSALFFTEISTQFYIVRLISIFTIVGILIINAFIQLKMSDNKFFIESNYYKELITLWKEVNDRLPGDREFGLIYNHCTNDFKDKNIKLVMNQGNKKLKLRFNTNYQACDKSIFKTKEDWNYFLNILPWNLINDRKEWNYEI